MKKYVALLLAAVMMLSAAALASEFAWEAVVTVPDFGRFAEGTFTLNEYNAAEGYTEYVYSGKLDDAELVREYMELLDEEYGYVADAVVDNVDSLADRVWYLDGNDLMVAQFARASDPHPSNIQIQMFRYYGADDVDVIVRLGSGLKYED